MPVTFTSKAGTTCSCEADDDGLARRISLDCFRAEWDFCPTTLAPQPESVSLAPMLPSWVVTRHDGCGHTVFTWDGGMGGTSCVYDSSTQQLIGASISSDTWIQECKSGIVRAGAEDDCTEGVLCSLSGPDRSCVSASLCAGQSRPCQPIHPTTE